LILVALLQGLFYIVTGLWPLLSMGTFLQVTGGKTDLWLVRTVGLLVAIIGAALFISGFRNELRTEQLMLALLTPMTLAAVDVYYVVKGQIGKIYLLDALAEIAIIFAWISTLLTDI